LVYLYFSINSAADLHKAHKPGLTLR